MSIILNALRRKKKTSTPVEAKKAPTGIVWGDQGQAYERRPPSYKLVFSLLGVLVLVLGASFGLWRYNKNLSNQKRAELAEATKILIEKNPPTVLAQPKEETLEDLLAKSKEHFANGEYSKSIETLTKALKKDPENALAHSDMGMSLLKQNLFQESKKHFETAVKLDPNCAECFNNLGYLHATLDNAEQAKMAYKKAIMLSRTYSDPYFNLGVLHEQHGDFGTARDYYNQFLSHRKNKSEDIFVKVKERVSALTE